MALKKSGTRWRDRGMRFRDDGAILDAAGVMPQGMWNAWPNSRSGAGAWSRAIPICCRLFSQMRGWSPSQGWIVRGASMTAYSVGNTVCLIEKPTVL